MKTPRDGGMVLPEPMAVRRRWPQSSPAPPQAWALLGSLASVCGYTYTIGCHMDPRRCMCTYIVRLYVTPTHRRRRRDGDGNGNDTATARTATRRRQRVRARARHTQTHTHTHTFGEDSSRSDGGRGCAWKAVSEATRLRRGEKARRLRRRSTAAAKNRGSRGHGRKKGTGRGGRARPGPHRRREKAAADMAPEARLDCGRGAAAVASSARR